MTNQDIVKGSALMVFLGGSAIGFATSHALSLTTNTTEVSTKDHGEDELIRLYRSLPIEQRDLLLEQGKLLVRHSLKEKAKSPKPNSQSGGKILQDQENFSLVANWWVGAKF